MHCVATGSVHCVNVLVCTDGSEDAIDAARQALHLLAPADSVTVACVVEPPASATFGMESGFSGGLASQVEIDDGWVEVMAGANDAIDRTLAALSTTAAIERRVEVGKAGDAICRLAGELSSDVVVVGSRGRGAVRRALLGSVSTHVVHSAPCPVVVVRASTDR